VIGGYLRGKPTFDALLVGYYQQDKVMFVGKLRNGFVPRVKADVAKRFKGLETTVCPFANLPEPKNARRGMALYIFLPCIGERDASLGFMSRQNNLAIRQR